MCCVLLPSWWTKQWLEQEKLYSWYPGCWKLNSHCWIVLYCNLKVAGSWQSILKLVSRMSSHWSLSLEAGKMRLPLLAVLTSQVKKIVNYFFQAMSCRTSPPPLKLLSCFLALLTFLGPWTLLSWNVQVIFAWQKTLGRFAPDSWCVKLLHSRQWQNDSSRKCTKTFLFLVYSSIKKSHQIFSPLYFFGRMNLARSFFPERSS